MPNKPVQREDRTIKPILDIEKDIAKSVVVSPLYIMTNSSVIQLLVKSIEFDSL